MNEIPNSVEQQVPPVADAEQAQTTAGQPEVAEPAPASMPQNATGVPTPPPFQTNYPWQPALAIPKPPFEADGRECFLVLLAVALGVLLRELLFLPQRPGFSAIVLVAAVYGVVLWYGKTTTEFRVSAGWPFGVVTLVLLCCVGLYSNRTLSTLNLFGTYFFLTLHVAAMFGHRGEFFQTLWQSAFCAPFTSAGAIFRTMGSSKKIEKGTAWRKVLLGVVISVPVAAVVMLLLVSADQAFESAVNNVIGSIGQTVWRILVDLLIGAVLAVFIFSALYTARRKHSPERPATTATEPKRPFDSTIATTVILVCCVIYVCFLMVQFNYLFSAVWGRLPTDTVYSAYARRGFFELTVVAAINLILLLFAVFSKQNGGIAVKVSVSALTVLTLALIASAFSKMVMYINAYGLTPLRVYTSWFMLLLAVVFLLLLAGRFCKKLQVGKAIVAGTAVLFLALNFATPDAMIARVNTQRHIENPATQADVALFEQLGDESVSYLITLAQSGEVNTAHNARYLLHMRYVELSKLDWRSMNASTLRAKALMEANLALFSSVNSPASNYTGRHGYFSADFFC